MHYFILSEKDATVKSYLSNVNFGQDHFLEIGTSYVADSNINISRTLISFDESHIEELRTILANTGTYIYLNLYSVRDSISSISTLYIYDATSSWAEGTGRTEYTVNKLSDGITWDSQPSTGNYYTTITMPYNVFDIKADVTQIVSSSIANGNSIGFLLKLDNSAENISISESYSNYKFYSNQTNTIYPPRLEISYNDYIGTGTLTVLSDTDLIVVNRNMMKEYKYNSSTQFTVYGRQKFPSRTWKENATSTKENMLPNYVYYSLIDHITGEKIIDFDDNTRISCNNTLGNYFNFNFNGIFPERYYKFKFKIKCNNIEKLLNDSPIFKVIR